MNHHISGLHLVSFTSILKQTKSCLSISLSCYTVLNTVSDNQPPGTKNFSGTWPTFKSSPTADWPNALSSLAWVSTFPAFPPSVWATHHPAAGKQRILGSLPLTPHLKAPISKFTRVINMSWYNKPWDFRDLTQNKLVSSNAGVAGDRDGGEGVPSSKILIPGVTHSSHVPLFPCHKSTPRCKNRLVAVIASRV